MSPAPAFALLVIRQLIVVYTASAHAFIVSDSIADLVAWGGGWCSVGLYFFASTDGFFTLPVMLHLFILVLGYLQPNAIAWHWMRLFLISRSCSRLLFILLLQKLRLLSLSLFQKISRWRLRLCSSDIIVGLAQLGLYLLDYLHFPLICFCFSAICSWILWRGADCTFVHNLSDFVAVCCLSRLVQNYACSRFLVSVYLMLALGVIYFDF